VDCRRAVGRAFLELVRRGESEARARAVAAVIVRHHYPSLDRDLARSVVAAWTGAVTIH